MEADFRLRQFRQSSVERSGQYIGREVYWKLYVIENVLRVVIHSVMTIENPNPADEWSDLAIDECTKRKIAGRRQDYQRHGRVSSPGAHNIYYLDLSYLRKILREQAHLIRPVIANIDEWVLRLERIRLPRNLVGHMNWPNRRDRAHIDRAYAGLAGLVGSLSHSARPIPILIPPRY